MTAGLDARRRRAAYRAARRGTKEMDWLLGRFAAARVAGMSPNQLARFERLLAAPDPEIEGWILGLREPDDGALAPLVEALRSFHGLAA